MNDIRENQPMETGNEMDREVPFRQEPAEETAWGKGSEGDGKNKDLGSGENFVGGGDTEGDALRRDDLLKALQQKDEELSQKQDRLLRCQADHENYKKRVEREKADMLKYSNERLMKEFLPVLDNFERSLSHVRNTNSVESVIEGIELTRKELFHTLTRFGLREITSRGEKFDPSQHEATAQVPTSAQQEGTVVEELQKGYFIHERLLRPAMVMVAVPPKDAEHEHDEQEAVRE